MERLHEEHQPMSRKQKLVIGVLAITGGLIGPVVQENEFPTRILNTLGSHRSDPTPPPIEDIEEVVAISLPTDDLIET